MEKNVIDESVINKIKKLIEKSQSTDSLEESETFMLKAQEMLQKYNLEQSVVESHKSITERGDFMTEVRIKYSDSFEKSLMTAIARNNFCHDLYTSQELYVIGKTVNVDTVIYLFNFFKTKLRSLSLVAYENQIKETKAALLMVGVDFSNSKMYKRAFDGEFMPNYLIGGVHGIRSKMQNAIRQAENSHVGLKGLILHNDKSIQKFIKEKYGRVKKSSKRDGVDTNSGAYQKGYSDGRNMEHNFGISTKNAERSITKQLS